MDHETLNIFRRQASTYIKWASREYGPGIADSELRAIKNAKNFKEIETILSNWDNGTFMQMVQDGIL